MRRVVVAGMLAVGLVVAPMPAQAQPKGEALQAALAALPEIVAKAMDRTGVPGVAVAVVHGKNLVYAEGFGVRDVRTRKRVTPKTVFQLASVSKPVAGSVIAAAVGKGTLDWSDPITGHLPWFALSDPVVTQLVTVGDMMAHRSGLPGQAGNDLEYIGFSRRHIIGKIGLENLGPFRTHYDYANFGVTIGGEAAASAAGMSWDRLAKRMLFTPLGMTHTSYSHADFLQQPNRAALSERLTNGRWIRGQERNADPQAPAGGLSSNVLDMSRWLRMELANGVFKGRRIVSPAALKESRSLQSRVSAPDADATSLSGYGYGMGITVNGAGRIEWSHAGAFSQGASTRILMIPALNVGIVALTNGMPVGAPEAITRSFADILQYGSVQEDWLTYYADLYSFLTPNFTIDGKPRPKNPRPSRDLNAYVGTFANDYVGTASITQGRGRSLYLQAGVGFRARLRHWDGDTFFIQAQDAAPGTYQAIRFTGGKTVDTVELGFINYGLGVMPRVDAAP